MQRQKTIKSLKCPSGCTIAMLCSLCFVSILTILISSPNIAFPCLFFGTATTTASVSLSLVDSIFRRSLHSQISGLQSQVGILLEQLHTESSESKVLAKFSSQVLQIAISLNKLADGLSGLHGSSASPSSNELSSIHEDLTETEETDDEEGSTQGMVFRLGELRNYTSSKPSRLSGKKSFLGVESINPSIGLACAGMATNVDRFMSYKIYGICPDDWDIAQKLILNGCDPLPRRRCFSRTPPLNRRSMESTPTRIRVAVTSQRSKVFTRTHRLAAGECPTGLFGKSCDQTPSVSTFKLLFL
ncbi:hypothetical protein SLEP1_g57245 [Rubroshorea leprosula]|uniref:Uncharacterized protein n=1 Tax=Rubroshorea leprosula TaxID=152421 RepID=A0AAV5MKN3_9ROSI|nr:hypothetical protein SLEP1_g57245 [Rubroshorea leprosula]